MEEEIKEVKTTLGDEVDTIKMILENVTNKNISVIAEGHLNLDRKLDEALKISRNQEMLFIRVNVLEEDVKRIKEHINKTA